jgi:iron complex transport system substrate-binding protein
MKRSTLRRITPLLCAVILASQAGCSGKKTETTGNPTAGTAGGGNFPLVIKHAFGETVIERTPVRVAAISWGNQDVPLALDVVPVGLSEANYGVLDGGRLLPWTKARLEELGAADYIVFSDTDGLDFEAINAANPDVILAGSSGITREEYDTLSEIAPTIAYPGRPWQTLWRDQIMQDAKGMAMEAEAQQLISGLDALIAETLKKYPGLVGKRAAFFYFAPTDFSTFSIYSPSDPRCAFLLDLGLTIPDSVLKLSESSESFYLTISAENADLVQDVDIIITWGSAGDDDLLSALRADTLLGLIPAVKQGSIVVLEESPLAASQTPSALSIPWTIDEYVSAIAAASEKAQ